MSILSAYQQDYTERISALNARHDKDVKVYFTGAESSYQLGRLQRCPAADHNTAGMSIVGTLMFSDSDVFRVRDDEIYLFDNDPFAEQKDQIAGSAEDLIDRIWDSCQKLQLMPHECLVNPAIIQLLVELADNPSVIKIMFKAMLLAALTRTPGDPEKPGLWNRMRKVAKTMEPV